MKIHQSITPIIIIIILITLITFTGCNTTTVTPTSPNSTSTSPLARANRDYQSARYSSAYGNATAAYHQNRSNSAIHKQAAYLAGLSAYQLHQYDDASKYLQPLRADPDPEIAGNSSATLGLIAREQNQPAQAIPLFRNAYRKLTGQDRAEAAYQTGLSYRDLNQTAQARQQFLLARSASQDSQFRSRVDQYISTTVGTVQLGRKEEGRGGKGGR